MNISVFYHGSCDDGVACSVNSVTTVGTDGSQAAPNTIDQVYVPSVTGPELPGWVEPPNYLPGTYPGFVLPSQTLPATTGTEITFTQDSEEEDVNEDFGDVYQVEEGDILYLVGDRIMRMPRVVGDHPQDKMWFLGEVRRGEDGELYLDRPVPVDKVRVVRRRRFEDVDAP